MPDSSVVLPEWLSPPGRIISKILEEKRIDLDDFASRIGINTRNARDLLEGAAEIDEVLASRLANVVGSTAAFWLRCERNYRADLQRNMPSYVDEDVKGWLKRLPLKEMNQLGWLKLHADVRRDSPWKKFVDAYGDEVLACEMEGSGFASSCDRKNSLWVVFRGIADYANNEKTDKPQGIATFHAALAARCFLVNEVRPRSVEF